jgi:tripartite-type tricarboxylate transporter receptor subunit TctC
MLPRLPLRRLAATLLAFAPVMATAQTAPTSDYPAKPVRIIIPFPPGGVTDSMGRLVAMELQKAWGSPVVPENRPGAASIIGAEAAARSAPDGYTLFIGHHQTHATNPHLFDKLPYHPVRDFAPVSLLVHSWNLLVVHPSVPARTLAELVKLARDKPGTVTYASQGNGTSGHISGELLAISAKADMIHVPYRGAGPAQQDLLGGQVNMLFDTIFSQLGNVKAGKVRALGLVAPTRNALVPEVPTMTELGMPEVNMQPWFALFAPAGTPREIIRKVNTDVVRIMNSAEVKPRLEAQGLTVVASSPEALAQHVEREGARWGKVIREANIKPD